MCWRSRPYGLLSRSPGRGYIFEGRSRLGDERQRGPGGRLRVWSMGGHKCRYNRVLASQPALAHAVGIGIASEVVPAFSLARSPTQQPPTTLAFAFPLNMPLGKTSVPAKVSSRRTRWQLASLVCRPHPEDLGVFVCLAIILSRASSGAHPRRTDNAGDCARLAAMCANGPCTCAQRHDPWRKCQSHRKHFNDACQVSE